MGNSRLSVRIRSGSPVKPVSTCPLIRSFQLGRYSCSNDSLTLWALSTLVLVTPSFFLSLSSSISLNNKSKERLGSVGLFYSTRSTCLFLVLLQLSRFNCKLYLAD
ncbi:uncharacterized protein BKA55DRAFT_201151 [Fusarium redolens]|uniref:Uncharacterized protein n=1 Tax=Fusarium redolens TaxID=48865 RepID=A0A9P9JMQ1_FUSRE|nr:uncharacterized protein BKA55DRAFT_201151 [Fusarium redolens]KAH7230443.1 hypothetical protein BKA55DRAFT_201151 [Fusarium redolens]